MLCCVVLWLIALQYTHPHYCVVDLYAFFCPECLTPALYPPTVLELLLRAGKFAEQGLHKMGTVTKEWVGTVKGRVVGRWRRGRPSDEHSSGPELEDMMNT
jgi:hypothetical protein